MQREIHLIDLEKIASTKILLAPYGTGDVPDQWPYSVVGINEQIIQDTMREFGCVTTLYRRDYASPSECFITLCMGEMKEVAVYSCEYQGKLVGYIWLVVGASSGTWAYICPRHKDWEDRYCFGNKGLNYRKIANYLARFGFDPINHVPVQE